MFENSNNSHRERQSINRCESQDICSQHWIKDLIGSKKEKLVDVVNFANSGDESQTYFEIKSETLPKYCVKEEELSSSELNISYISSKSGSTSIGSTSTGPSVTLPNASAQALNECQSCHSCQHLQRDVPSQSNRQISGFHTSEAKAVHLHNQSSRVNVPIVRSVSSSVITGRPFSGSGSSGCIFCTTTCADCVLEGLQTISHLVSNDSTNDKNKCHQNSNVVPHKFSTSRVTDLNSDQQITPGLVAQRKIEILRRQVSESSFFAHSCLICGKTSDALNNENNENFWNYLIKHKMICEKIKDNEKNGHHYEEIMDYKNNCFVSCEKHSKPTNGVESKDRDDEYELKYGPGIVNKLKHRFMSISLQSQQSCQSSNFKLKRSSSLENILLDSRHNQPQQSLPSHVSRNSPSCAQNNHIFVPLLAKNGTINVRSITDAGNRFNGSQVSHRLYIQHHNNKNLYNSKSSAIVPLIKRAKSMETLLLSDDKQKSERDHQQINCASNQLLSNKRETPIRNHKNDLQLNDRNVLICDKTDSNKSQISANSAMSETTTKSVTQLSNGINNGINNGITDEMPKPDTVKTCKRIFELTGAKNGPENGKSINSNNNSVSKNNYKKSPLNGSSSTANVKRKPPVVRATNKSAALKTQTPVTSSSAIKSQSPVPQMIEKTATPRTTTTTTSTSQSVVGQNDKNNNSSDINKSANTCPPNTCPPNSTTVRKPPIAPKRASLTLKPNPLTGMTAINKNNKINGSLSINNNNCNALKKVQKTANNLSISSDNKLTEKCPKPKPNDSLNSKPLTVNSKKESSDISCNTQMNGKQSEALDSCENSTNKSKVIKPIANIKPFTQNNQINGELKSEVIPNDCQTVDSEQNGIDIGYNKTNDNSIEDKSEPQSDKDLVSENKQMNSNNNNVSNKSDNETNGNVLESPLISNVNCNANANKESEEEKSVVVNDENVSPNTCDIAVVKTRVNDPNSRPNESRVEDSSMHSQQTLDVLKPSLILNSESSHPTKTATSSLWSQQNKKNNSNSSTTTIVFDFRGKDVKSNLAIHPLPFGVSGPKKLNSSNGSVNDSDDDENYSGSTDIPLPSGIIFLGENIVVGKGSLLLTRNKKLSIQFNDSATETYEYPSEGSVSSDVELTNSPNSSVISELSSRTTTLKGLGVCQGRLGSYKPTVIDTPFELGVSRVETQNNDSVVSADNEQEESDVVKPANPDETSSWSTSSTASDLLF